MQGHSVDESDLRRLTVRPFDLLRMLHRSRSIDVVSHARNAALRHSSAPPGSRKSLENGSTLHPSVRSFRLYTHRRPSMSHSLASSNRAPLSIDINHVPMLRPFKWLWMGAQDLRKSWGASLGYGALTVALGWTLLVFCGTHPYLVAAAISGFLLVGPLMSAGLCEISRLFSQGMPANFDASLGAFARHREALVELGLLFAACAVGWFVLSGILLDKVFDVAAPDMRETLYRGFLDSANRDQILAYIAVGGMLAAAVFAVSVVSIPLIIDRDATPGQAVRASLYATGGNLAAMIVWSALILVLTAIGYATLLIGLLLIVPWLGHATWHAYKDLVR
jgi:uncharacterized membrane protein